MTSAENPLTLTEVVNRVFGDRYRAEELIGVGSNSAVYTAYDPVEGHWVALKVFDQTVANDTPFVENLLAAAERAAELTHPNIATVLDWGVDGGPYIVSELFEGGSLETLLSAGKRLEVSQALVMTLECCRALKYGHDQGVGHHGVSPENIVFSEDGHARLVDYGLIDVLADAPGSKATRGLESVVYASPEQARGRPLTTATDMYSLALAVNEAVTGMLPPISDTVVGTLMARAEAAAELSPRLNGLLPVLERCGRVEAEERPEAEELSIALLAAAETMPRPGELPLVGLATPEYAADSPLRIVGGKTVEAGAELDLVDSADDDFDVSALGPLEATSRFAGDDDNSEAATPDVQADDSPTGPVPLALVTDPAPTVALEDLDTAEPVFVDVDTPDTKPGTLDVPTQVAGRSSTAVYEQVEDDADDGLPWWPLVLLGLLVAGAVAAGVYFFAFDAAEETAAVPDLIGAPFDEVANLVDEGGWELERLEGRVDGSVPGAVLSQSPDPGEQLASGQTVTVTVSLGNEMVEIPSEIVGLSVDQASSMLGAVGLGVGRLTEEPSEALASGLVIGLNEPTTQKPMGQGVALRVSTGPEDRFVPNDVVGMTIGDATSLLVGLRLQAVEEPTFSEDIEVGIVLDVIPEAGSVVPADSAVTLLVSAGPEPVVMPDVIGLALDEAIDMIEELGLIFIDTEGTPGEPVIGTLPPIGATVDVGTEVLIYLDEPSDDEEGEEDEG